MLHSPMAVCNGGRSKLSPAIAAQAAYTKPQSISTNLEQQTSSEDATLLTYSSPSAVSSVAEVQDTLTSAQVQDVYPSTPDDDMDVFMRGPGSPLSLTAPDMEYPGGWLQLSTSAESLLANLLETAAQEADAAFEEVNSTPQQQQQQQVLQQPRQESNTGPSAEHCSSQKPLPQFATTAAAAAAFAAMPVDKSEALASMCFTYQETIRLLNLDANQQTSAVFPVMQAPSAAAAPAAAALPAANMAAMAAEGAGILPAQHQVLQQQQQQEIVPQQQQQQKKNFGAQLPNPTVKRLKDIPAAPAAAAGGVAPAAAKRRRHVDQNPSSDGVLPVYGQFSKLPGGVRPVISTEDRQAVNSIWEQMQQQQQQSMQGQQQQGQQQQQQRQLVQQRKKQRLARAAAKKQSPAAAAPAAHSMLPAACMPVPVATLPFLPRLLVYPAAAAPGSAATVNGVLAAAAAAGAAFNSSIDAHRALQQQQQQQATAMRFFLGGQLQATSAGLVHLQGSIPVAPAPASPAAAAPATPGRGLSVAAASASAAADAAVGAADDDDDHPAEEDSSESPEQQHHYSLRSERFRGVYRSHHGWRAQIYSQNKPVNLGTYSTEEEAARVWNEAAMFFRGSDTWQNAVRPTVRPGYQAGKLCLTSARAVKAVRKAAAAAGNDAGAILQEA